jgi:putative DNA primase/helicase
VSETVPDDKKARLLEAKRGLRWALESESAKRINAMLDLARSEPTMPILPAQLDSDPWLFNCPNGTLELRTGTLREHRREDFLTKLCPTPYNAEAICPTWERFLGAIFPNDEDEPDAELITFMQRLLGRCLTGDVSEQNLPIFWGSGANGKSTLVNAVLDTLGSDYAMKANADLLMTSRGERHPTELAGLFGMRLVVASETHQGRHLNESLVKDLTGGEPIRARRMREDFWEFKPTHKVVLLTNHKPRVAGTDEGIWRRLRLVPFTTTFWDQTDPGKDASQLPSNLRQDKQLGEKLTVEREGILAWLVRGCLGWQRDGLTLPDKVRVATTEYRSDEDVLAQWIEQCCAQGDRSFRCKAGELFAHYREWCERAGEEEILNQKTFGEALSARGFERKKSDGVYWRLGIALHRDDRDDRDHFSG